MASQGHLGWTMDWEQAERREDFTTGMRVKSLCHTCQDEQNENGKCGPCGAPVGMKASMGVAAYCWKPAFHR